MNREKKKGSCNKYPSIFDIEKRKKEKEQNMKYQKKKKDSFLLLLLLLLVHLLVFPCHCLYM